MPRSRHGQYAGKEGSKYHDDLSRPSSRARVHEQGVRSPPRAPYQTRFLQGVPPPGMQTPAQVFTSPYAPGLSAGQARPERVSGNSEYSNPLFPHGEVLPSAADMRVAEEFSTFSRAPCSEKTPSMNSGRAMAGQQSFNQYGWPPNPPTYADSRSTFGASPLPPPTANQAWPAYHAPSAQSMTKTAPYGLHRTPSQSSWGTDHTGTSPLSPGSMRSVPPPMYDQPEIGPSNTSRKSVQKVRAHQQRRHNSQDEFGGAIQSLPDPSPESLAGREELAAEEPMTLQPAEQEKIFQSLEDRLSKCAYLFVYKYEFPVPLENNRPEVKHPSDRTWTEWAYLLKRLATKRRVPARLLHDEQIKNMITIVENSILIRPLKGENTRQQVPDSMILQYISAGIQVAKLLKDGAATNSLSNLYKQTERDIMKRKGWEQAA